MLIAIANISYTSYSILFLGHPLNIGFIVCLACSTLLFAVAINTLRDIRLLRIQHIAVVLTAIGVASNFFSTAIIADNLSSISTLHILLISAAYGCLLLATIFAAIISIEDRLLRRAYAFSFLPPLELTEKTLFSILNLGWLLLTAGIVTGFTNHLQTFSAKIALALIAWAIYSVLILGRSLCQIRGKQAVTLTLISSAILVILLFII